MEYKINDSFYSEFLDQFQQFPWLRTQKLKEPKVRRRNQRRKYPSDPTNGLTMNGYCIPYEILIQIFNELDVKSLAICSSVCIRWNAVIRQVIWRERLKSILGHPIRQDVRPKYIKQFCFEQKFNVNLVQNPSGADGIRFWKTRDGESFEDIDYSNYWETLDVDDVQGDQIKNDGINRWFQINYNLVPWYWDRFRTAKCQKIELKKFGFTNEFIDEVQPPILIQDWYRFSSIDENYSISVVLGNENTTKIQEFHFYDCGNSTNRGQWNEVRHEFMNYGKGVRFVYLVHDSVKTVMEKLSAKISGTSITISSSILL